MSELLRRLREQRGALMAQMQTLADAATAENRAFNADEQSSWDELEPQLKALDERIKGVLDTQRDEDRSRANFDALVGGISPMADAEANRLFRDRFTHRSAEPIDLRVALPHGTEMRAAVTSSGFTGTTFARAIVEALVSGSGVLAAGARSFSTATGEVYKIPRQTGQSVSTITLEGTTITESDPSADTVSLSAYKYGHLVKTTHELVNDASFDIAGWVARESGKALGVSFGNHLLNGTGSGQPTGILSDVSKGVTGSTAAQFYPSADDLIDLAFSLDALYLPRAAWVMAGPVLAEVRKLKAQGTGDFLFQTDVNRSAAGSVGSLLGHPVFLDSHMPGVAASAKNVLFGDFSSVWVRSVEGVRFEMSRDFEFDSDVVTWRALHRLDSVLVDTAGLAAFTAPAS